MPNVYDQFDAQAAQSNVYDQFDKSDDMGRRIADGQKYIADAQAKYPNSESGPVTQADAPAPDAHWYSSLLQKDPELAKLPWYQRIPAGAADAAEAIDPSGVIRSRLSGPTDFPAPVPFPEPNPQDSVPVAALKGAANFPSRAWDFLSSPGGAALAAGGGEVLDPKMIAALFTAQQGSQAITAPNLSPQERVELALGAVAGAKGVHELGKPAVVEPKAGAGLPSGWDFNPELGPTDKATEATVPKGPTEQPAPIQQEPPVTQASGETQPQPEPVRTSSQERTTGDEPFLSRIANRFTDERQASGELGEVAPGQGFSRRDLMNRGLQMPPEEITQHVSDAMNDSGGDHIAQAAAITAEEARLSDRSLEASRAAEAQPSVENLKAQDDAFKDLTDFHNGPVAKIKQRFHTTGMALQGELPVDLGTFNGLREAWLNDTGKAPPSRVEPMLRRTARNVTDSAGAEHVALDRLGTEIDRATTGRRLVDPDALREAIAERMKDMPCII